LLSLLEKVTSRGELVIKAGPTAFDSAMLSLLEKVTSRGELVIPLVSLWRLFSVWNLRAVLCPECTLS
jgi:hypothetical protein